MISYFENELKNLKTLLPCEETNKVFTQLYNYCTESRKDFIKIAHHKIVINKFRDISQELWYFNIIDHKTNHIRPDINKANGSLSISWIIFWNISVLKNNHIQIEIIKGHNIWPMKIEVSIYIFLEIKLFSY